MTRVLIIGGGISGLSAAYALQEALRQSDRRDSCQLTLLEQDGRWGGKILTEEVGGFLLEGGPDSFVSFKPWALALCSSMGLEGDLMGTNPRQKTTYVLCRGKLVPLPEGLMLMGPGSLLPFLASPLLSPCGKIRAGFDLFVPPRRGEADESLASFVRRRVGGEMLERVVEPLMAGIYAGDAEHLSVRSTFPRLLDIEKEHGSLIRGMMAKGKPAASEGSGEEKPRWSMFVTLRGGLAQLSQSLVERLSHVTMTSRRSVVSLHRKGNQEPRYFVQIDNGEILEGEAVVLATPAFVSGALLEGLNPGLASLLKSIPYLSTATVSLAYRREGIAHPLGGYGFVIPKGEKRRIIACTWTSTKWPHRSPEDHVLLRCYLGGAGQEEVALLEEGKMLDVVREEVRSIMGITAEPALARVYRWEKSMPQYLVGHEEKLSTMETLLAGQPGLFLAGSAYRGIGIPDCIHDGEVVASKVVAYLKEQQETKELPSL